MICGNRILIRTGIERLTASHLFRHASHENTLDSMTDQTEQNTLTCGKIRRSGELLRRLPVKPVGLGELTSHPGERRQQFGAVGFFHQTESEQVALVQGSRIGASELSGEGLQIGETAVALGCLGKTALK